MAFVDRYITCGVGLVDYFHGMLSHPDRDKPLAVYFVDVAVTIETS